MTDAPETIYLQWIPEGNPYDDEITWCEDEIHNEDIKYTRTDIADKRIAELEASLNLRDEALADYEIDWEMWRE